MTSDLFRTGIIRFNVKDRGRKFLGQDRNFDTVALANVINSGAVQERVAKGDMYGYYGHWPRNKFGMDVTEGGFVGGKRVDIEPAHRTISIKAFPDGTIEHETEFLNTTPGKLALRLYQSKAGGFSSAITAPRRGSMQVPESFHGFDYVLEPNYSTNRGHTLDGLSDEDGFTLDEVAEYNGLLDSTTALLDRIQNDYDILDDAFTKLERENAEMRSMLAKKNISSSIVLDGVIDVVSHSTKNRFENATDFFDAPLAGFEAPQKDSEPVKPMPAAEKSLLRRFNF